MAPEMLLLTAEGLNEKTGFSATKAQIQKGYSNAVDWWALGVTTYNLFVDSIPFLPDEVSKLRQSTIIKFRRYDSCKLGDDLAEVYHENMKFHEYISLFQRFDYPEYLSDIAKDFISKLLEIDEEKRLGSGANGFRDIQQHSFFADIDWEKLVQRQVPPPYLPNIQISSNVGDVTAHNEFHSPVAPTLSEEPTDKVQFEVKDFYDLLVGSELIPPKSENDDQQKNDLYHMQEEYQKYFDKW
jgi:serine/threonine protein kinase